MLSYKENIKAILDTNLPQIKDEVKDSITNRIIGLSCRVALDEMKKELESMVNEDYIPCTGGYVLRTLTEAQVMNTIDKYQKGVFLYDNYETTKISLSKMD